MCSITIGTHVRLTLPPQLGLAALPPAPAAAPEPGGRPPAPYAAVEPARGDLAAHAHDVLALPDGKMLVPAHGRLLMMLSSQAPSYQGAVGRPSSGPLHLK